MGGWSVDGCGMALPQVQVDETPRHALLAHHGAQNPHVRRAKCSRFRYVAVGPDLHDPEPHLRQAL